MKTDGHENAFPHLDQNGEVIHASAQGLTKREYFAAIALQGLKANSTPGSHHRPDNAAKEAVELADFLIKELNKGNSDV